MNVSHIIAKIVNDISAVINSHLQDSETFGIGSEEIAKLTEKIFTKVFGDLKSLSERDPAANDSIDYVYNTYASLKAVIYYRISNEIFYYKNIGWEEEIKFEESSEVLRLIARTISEEAKKETSIEIHPAAKIGDNFVIDHGANTVIGETVEIGNNCYILQGVVLGSRNITGNDSSKRRHPKLGNNVEIASFVKLLGPINIGDNVFIGPGCIIAEDIPSNSNVLMITQCQVSKRGKKVDIVVYGVVPEDNMLTIYGSGLKNTKLVLVDSSNSEVDNIKMVPINSSDNTIKVILDGSNEELNNISTKKYRLGLKNSDGLAVILTSSKGLNDYISLLLSSERR